FVHRRPPQPHCPQAASRATSYVGTGGQIRLMTSPLIITRDETLLDELRRLTAPAGVTPEVAPDPGGALRSWSASPVVLVGVDVAAAVGRLAAPRPRARDALRL